MQLYLHIKIFYCKKIGIFKIFSVKGLYINKFCFKILKFQSYFIYFFQM